MNGPWEKIRPLDAKRNQAGTGGMVCTTEEKTKKEGDVEVVNSMFSSHKPNGEK